MRTLLTCGLLAATALPAAADHTKPVRSVAKLAAQGGRFTTLLAAVKAAGLADALDADGPITLFAPTDEAFKKLPEGAVADLLKPENKAELVRLLKYHVVAGKVSAKDAVAAESAKTLQGGSVRARIVDGRLRVNDSDVRKTDVPAANGVIHILDTVLIPPKGH